MDKTKKDIIKEAILNDPTLRHDQLAEIADTTSGYVRDALCTLGLSLRKLRVDYYKDAKSKLDKALESLIEPEEVDYSKLSDWELKTLNDILDKFDGNTITIDKKELEGLINEDN